MKNNLLFLTRRKNGISSLEVDLDRHVYVNFDNEEDWLNDNLEKYGPFFISEQLFDLISKGVENNETYVCDPFCSYASNLMLEECPNSIKHGQGLTKQEVLTYLKGGFLNIDQKEINTICRRISKYGADESCYLIGEDILNIYRKYINQEISNKLFADYAYFVCHALGCCPAYKNDDINSMIKDIEWGFGGLSFCGDNDFASEGRDTDPAFYLYIKSCCYKIDRFFGRTGLTNKKIKNRYFVHLFHFEWNHFFYIIEDTKENCFNYGDFSINQYVFNLDYFYDFMVRDEFYSLLENYLSDADEEEMILNKQLSIFNI